MHHHLTADTRPAESAGIVLHFTPNWFAASMGTGIFAVALGQFPSMAVPHLVGQGLFVANIALFALLAGLYGLKWLHHPRLAVKIFAHPVQSMFLGTIPMALATVVNGLLIYGPDMIGEPLAVSIAARLWLADTALALAVGIGVPLLMFTRQVHTIADMSAVWLLPVVATGVSAASGLLLLPHIGGGQMELGLFVVAIVLWACSLPLAFGILAILFLRLALHRLPGAAAVSTCWLALGPIGTGALGLALIAQNGKAVLVANGVDAGAIAGPALLGALVLWGCGLWWLSVALVATLRQIRLGLPFNLGWWAFTFPLGVYALATLKLGALLPLDFFPLAGGTLVCLLAVIWCVVAGRSLAGAVRGRLFHDPCFAVS